MHVKVVHPHGHVGPELAAGRRGSAAGRGLERSGAASSPAWLQGAQRGGGCAATHRMLETRPSSRRTSSSEYVGSVYENVATGDDATRRPGVADATGASEMSRRSGGVACPVSVPAAAAADMDADAGRDVVAVRWRRAPPPSLSSSVRDRGSSAASPASSSASSSSCDSTRRYLPLLAMTRTGQGRRASGKQS